MGLCLENDEQYVTRAEALEAILGPCVVIAQNDHQITLSIHLTFTASEF